MDLNERISKVELEKELAALESDQSSVPTDNPKSTENFHSEREPSKFAKIEELEDKKKELVRRILLFYNKLKCNVECGNECYSLLLPECIGRDDPKIGGRMVCCSRGIDQTAFSRFIAWLPCQIS